ncbi:MAG: cupin domain-containing protein, partial [Candidatus Sulfotelmatobacter sp.]
VADSTRQPCASSDVYVRCAFGDALCDRKFPGQGAELSKLWRTKLDWHIHPGSQVLLITEGTGYYQERGKPVRIVHKGDVIKCAPGVGHRHGASPGSSFAYIAVTPTQKGKTIWLEPVSDKDYNSVK